MTWYLDSSAFVKLVQLEDESSALREWTLGRETCSSDLLRTEVRRVFVNDVGDVQTLMEGLLVRTELIRLTPTDFDDAGRLRVAGRLRSLDAIHIVAARRLGPDLEGIVTYDRRMTEAAQSLGIVVAAPA